MNRRSFFGKLFRAAATACALSYATPALRPFLPAERVQITKNNPALVAHRILQSLLPAEEIDFDAFRAWAVRCEEEGLSWEGRDEPRPVYDVLCEIGERGRGIISCQVPRSTVTKHGVSFTGPDFEKATRFTVAPRD